MYKYQSTTERRATKRREKGERQKVDLSKNQIHYHYFFL